MVVSGGWSWLVMDDDVGSSWLYLMTVGGSSLVVVWFVYKPAR